MKLPEINKNNARLHVYIKGDVYSYPLYRDFASIKELSAYMQDEFYCKRKDFDYYYSK